MLWHVKYDGNSYYHCVCKQSLLYYRKETDETIIMYAVTCIKIITCIDSTRKTMAMNVCIWPNKKSENSEFHPARLELSVLAVGFFH